MRFQFCGNISCPQWFIAEISVLTKITAVKIKLIFTQLIQHYLENIDISSKVNKLLAGTGLDIYQIHAVIATLEFILKNSVMFQVNQNVMHKQLVDLGLPKQNVEAITKTYKSNKQKLFQKSGQKIMKISSNIEISYSIHQFLGSSNLGKIFQSTKKSQKFIECSLKYRDINEVNVQNNMIINEDTLDEMIYSLEEVLDIMNKYQNQKNYQ